MKMSQGKWKCPGCGHETGGGGIKLHKESCEKYKEKYGAEAWGIDKDAPEKEPKTPDTTLQNPLGNRTDAHHEDKAEEIKWVKPKRYEGTDSLRNKYRERHKEPVRKMEIRMRSMIDEGIFTVNAEKLLACRTPEVMRVKGALCLVINIFNEEMEK